MKVFKNKLYLIVLIIIIITIGGIWYSLNVMQQNHFLEEETVNKDSAEINQKTEEKPQTRLKNAEFTIYNNDKTVKWKLTASEIVRQENKALKMLPVTVKAFAHDNNQILYSLTGDRGYLKDDYFRIEGPIKITKGKITVEIGNLIWKQQQNLITGDEGLKLNTSGLKLSGDRFTTNTTLTRFTVYGNREQQAHLVWKERENESPKE